MKRLTYIFGIMLILTSSCSEFLFQEPSEQRSVNEQFSSKELSLQAINGMYYSLESLYSGKQFIYADLLGGNLSFAPDEKDYIIEIPPGRSIEKAYEFRDEKSDSDFATVYINAYSVINEANIILERIGDLDFFSNEEKNQIIAEALSVRAFSHYLLCLFYAQNYNFTPDASHPGIIYNTRVLIAGVDYPSRKSMAECYNLLKSDLDEALKLFGSQQALDKGPDYSYFNTLTVQALYARIALQMNDWEKALEYSDLVIQTSGIDLMDTSNLESEWLKPEDPVSEIILEFSAPRTSDEGTVSSSVGHEFYVFDTKTNYREFVASKDLYEIYDSADYRKKLFLEVLLPTSINTVISEAPYYFTRKFQDDPGTTCIRLAEMYLIKAEAYARIGGNDNLALIELNKIRTRSGLEALSSSDNILEEIFLERRRELAFEGHLLFDIARYKKDIIRTDCIASTCALSYPSDYYILPIPSSSTELNENIDQNEGY